MFLPQGDVSVGFAVSRVWWILKNVFQKKVMKWVKSGQNQLSKTVSFIKFYVDAESGITTGLYSQIKVAEVKIKVKNDGL